MSRLEMLIGLLSCFVMQSMCLGVFLDRSKITIRRIIRYSIYASMLVGLVTITKQDVPVGILLIAICLANIIFESTLMQKIWINLLAVSVMYGVATLDYMVVESIVRKYGNIWMYNQSVTDIRSAIEVSLLWLIARQSSVIYKSNGQYKRVTRRQAWTIVVIIFTATYILFICDSVYREDYELIKNSGVFIYFFISVLCITMLIVGINEEMNKLYYKWTSECMKEQLEKQLKYYHKLEEINRETRSIKHDIRNHMLIIKNLAKEGKLDKVEQYVRKIENTTEKLDHTIHTGHSIVDAILNEKLHIVEEKNIEMEYHVKLSMNLGLDDMDLCVIFANSLDNAIEACERMDSNQPKKIQIKAICDRGYFLYYIKNTTNEVVTIVNQEISTNKKDSINHGFGLANIRKSVERNNGTLNITSKQDEFCLEIDIPISSTEQLSQYKYTS